MNCQHCSIQTEMAEIRTIVERIDHELLGNGQPGKIQQLEGRAARLESWRSYASGALVVISALLTAAVAIGGVILAAKLKP
jgi:hypothetical protein